MQFEGRRKASAAPNLTPLIDIVFLLLVFFMLTAHFVRDEGLPIELPQAISADALDLDQPVEVNLTDDGEIYLQGELVGIDNLGMQLAPLLTNSKDKRVVIKGDLSASLGSSVAIMDAARAAGAEGVDIITRKPEGRP